MVQFTKDYFSAMDKPIETIDLSTKEIGISAGIGDPWVQLKTAVTAGASHVELGFMGVGKGSMASPTSITPEMIGREKRADIRQFAKINNVSVSTHASANVMGFSGLDRNKFDAGKAADAVSEVKRAIDFAGDVTEGGPVVIHTGEFPRPIAEAGKEFEAYKDEAKKAMWGLVDKNTGEIKAALTKDFKIPRVKTEVIDGMEVPIVDRKTGEYIYEKVSYDDFVKEAQQKGVPAEKLFYQELMEKERLRASAEEKRWATMADDYNKRYGTMKRMLESVRELAKKDKEAADYAAMKYVEEMRAQPSRESTEEYRDFLNNPAKYMEKAIEQTKKEVSYAYENSSAAGRKRYEIEMEIGNADKGIPGSIETLKQYGLTKSAENIALLGMYAIEIEKKKKLKNPLFIAPENIFPEQYGSHPQELKELVEKSRQALVEKLVAKQVPKEEAVKMAEEHIKATFDIGHANTWKKYFKGSDEDFKKWFMMQVKELIDKKIIGHVHIADNFGYHDEHLTPGQGNAPIEEFIKEFKKAGLKDKMVVEPGAQGEGESIHSSLLGAWARVAGSPMYRVGGVPKKWTDVEGSYFGRTFSPSYMAGSYLINPQGEENWWSGVPLE